MRDDVFALEEVVFVEEHWDFVDVKGRVVADLEVFYGLLYA